MLGNLILLRTRYSISMPLLSLLGFYYFSRWFLSLLFDAIPVVWQVFCFKTATNHGKILILSSSNRVKYLFHLALLYKHFCLSEMHCFPQFITITNQKLFVESLSPNFFFFTFSSLFLLQPTSRKTVISHPYSLHTIKLLIYIYTSIHSRVCESFIYALLWI